MNTTERTCQTCIGYLKPRWDCTTCHGTGRGPLRDEALVDDIWTKIEGLVQETSQRLFWGSQFCQVPGDGAQVEAALMGLVEQGKLDAFVSVHDDEGEEVWGSRLDEFDPEKWDDDDICIEMTFGLAEEHTPKEMPEKVRGPLLSEVRKSLDRLYRSVDDLIRADKFGECNRMLRDVTVEDMDTYLMVGLLTITATHAEQLPARADLFQRVQRRLVKVAPARHKKLLEGLE